MRVADHVQFGEPAPRALTWGLRTLKWGDPYGKGWMEWPAGLIDKANMAVNAHNAWRGYLSATKKASWSRSNPAAWEMVSWVIAQRMNKNGK